MDTESDVDAKWWYKVINLVMIGYCIIEIIKIMFHVYHSLKWYYTWEFTEFLINYRGGFVRRGMIGEILYQSYAQFDISLRWTVFCIITISFFCVLGYILRHVKMKKLCWWILPLNVCMFGADFARKDYLCMLCALFALWVYVRMKRLLWKMVCVNAILMIALNIHECTFFIIVPFMMLLFLRDDKNRTNIYVRSVCMLPSILMMTVLCVCKGNPEIAQTIWDSWTPITHWYANPEGSIQAIGWTGQKAVEFHSGVNFLMKSMGLYGWLTKPIVWLLVIYVCCSVLFIKKKAEQKHREIAAFMGIMIIQFISLFPMFTVLSCDGGRICFYWTVSSILIYLTLPSGFYEKLYSARFRAALERASTRLVGQAPYVPIMLLVVLCISPIGTGISGAMGHSVLGAYYGAPSHFYPICRLFMHYLAL